MSHLQGGKVDISLIQISARNNLINLLEKCPGKKAIVWDNSLAGPVGLVAQYTILREHMVTKMYPLRPEPLPETNVDHVIFISRPKLYLMNYIGNNTYIYKNQVSISIFLALNVHSYSKAKSGSKKQFHLFFVPKKSILCMERLKHKGVFGSVMLIDEFKCQLFPVDSDVMSMEISEAYR